MATASPSARCRALRSSSGLGVGQLPLGEAGALAEGVEVLDDVIRVAAAQDGPPFGDQRLALAVGDEPEHEEGAFVGGQVRADDDRGAAAADRRR